MKRFFSKLFSKSSSEDAPEETSAKKSKYMPEVKAPVEERFTIEFNNNGGKFLYCENPQEIEHSFDMILHDNDWVQSEMLCFDSKLTERFKKKSLTVTRTNLNATFFLTPCEYLVAQNGGLLISANQIQSHKLQDLPKNFVVFATTSQITETLSEGLKGIKGKYVKNIPTNITTIKHFNQDTDQEDFLTYGSTAKNLYLLLLEDL